MKDYYLEYPGKWGISMAIGLKPWLTYLMSGNRAEALSGMCRDIMINGGISTVI